jgi:hypothetical protein
MPRVICSYSGWFGRHRHPLGHRTSSRVDSKPEDQSDYYQNNFQRRFSIHGVLLSE